MQTSHEGCAFLSLPGEIRNRIYGHIIRGNNFRVLRKPTWRQSRPADHIWKSNLWTSGYGLTQACRSIRFEFLPLYRASVLDNVTPQNLYEYIDAFCRTPNISDDKIIGYVIVDFSANLSSCLDIKPLLQILRIAKDLHVGTCDIVELEGFELGGHTLAVPDVQDILAGLYDIVDLEAFYDYVENSMTTLEVECDEAKGVEIVFELGTDCWEDWMGVWSKPQNDPDSRVGIPLELGEKVVQWGRGCGMELNRAEGSHLTVNFRRGPLVPPTIFGGLGSL